MPYLKQPIITFLFLLIFTSTLFSKDKLTINFAPLPMKKQSKTIQDFVPMTSYLKQELGINTNYIYKKNYKNIVDSFIKGEIDIAFLGPLPLVNLRARYKDIEPIITVKQKNGSKYYRCVLSKFKKDKLDLEKPLRIALTQPLSTCGYFMSSKLLKDRYGIDLSKQKYDYKMSHSNAILSMLKGDFIIAGAKDTITKRHETLGIEIIAKSEYLPGFSFVANKKTLSKKSIDDIKKALLGLDEKTYKSWKGVLSSGFEKADISDYDVIDVDFDDIPFKGNIE